jgi:acetylornithine deacetylase/succinyl-diaminopimelate desuccinylase-like protein
MLLAARAVAAHRATLKRPIAIWVVSDGEVGDREGLRFLSEEGHLRNGMVVACEPSELKILRAFKGRLWLEIEVRGRTAHALAPGEAINAIAKMTDVLAGLRRLDLRPPGTSDCGEEILGEAAVTFTTIQGGSALNVSAGLCRATLDIRLMPGDSVSACLARMETILADLRRRDPGLDVSATPIPGSPREPIRLSDETPILRVMREAMARSGLTPAYGRGFSTGGLGNFFDHKIYGVFFGPGSIQEAHRANESVGLDDLLTAARVYAHAMLSAGGATS